MGEVVGGELPVWVFVSDEDVDAVAEWVSAGSWEESRARYAAVVAAMAAPEVDAVLEELRLGSDRLAGVVAVHRAVLALGGDVGYACLRGADEAARQSATAIAARDWGALRACGVIEAAQGLPLLGRVHEVMAATARSERVPPSVLEKIGDLVVGAQDWERERAMEDLAALGEGVTGELLAAVAPSGTTSTGPWPAAE
ncbi:hypothetical protein ACFQ9X_26300 [Catenulispora yoronensis]